MTTTQSQAPNILLIMADQLTPNVLPSYGHKTVKAPHIQALSDTGVVFENAYCNFPLCVPSRASMMAGRLANNIECWDNAAELPGQVPTMAHYLRGAGYHTVLCGKMHFVGPDQVHGFNERLTTDIYPSNFSWVPDWVEGEKYRPTGINMSAVVDAGVCVRSLQMDYDDDVENAGVQKIYDLARFNQDKPFFLTVSFTHPHSPYITTEEYWDRYNHDEVEMPSVDPIPVDELDQHSRWLHYAHAQEKHDVSDEQIRNARHAYYGMTSYIDDKVGHLMKTLKAAGLADNTIVILTADHGEMLGERGMWYKQSFFEDSVRVPLIISAPERYSAARVSENVSLVDLLPTFLDMASENGQSPALATPIDGQSLTGLLQGQADDWSDTVISEYTGEGVCEPCRMVKRGSWKFMYTHNHPDQLYNLADDPKELNNLADTEQVAQLQAELKAVCLDGWDPEDIKRRAIASQQARWLIKNTTDSSDDSWAYQVVQDKDARYVRQIGAVQTKAKARLPFVQPTPFKPE